MKLEEQKKNDRLYLILEDMETGRHKELETCRIKISEANKELNNYISTFDDKTKRELRRKLNNVLDTSIAETVCSQHIIYDQAFKDGVLLVAEIANMVLTKGSEKKTSIIQIFLNRFLEELA